MKKKGRSRKATCQGPGVKAWQCGRAASGCSERLCLNSQRRQSRASGWRFISRAVLRSNLAMDGSERLGSCGGCSLLFANRASWLSKGGLFELGWGGGPLLTTVARACWLGEGPRTEHPKPPAPLPSFTSLLVEGCSGCFCVCVGQAGSGGFSAKRGALPTWWHQTEGGIRNHSPMANGLFLLWPLEAGCDTHIRHTQLSYWVFWLGRESTQLSFSGEATETT